jgi:hypothetical protein
MRDLAAARERLSSAEMEERTWRASLDAAKLAVAQAQETLRRARTEEGVQRQSAAAALVLDQTRSGELAFAEERAQEAERRLSEALARTAAEAAGEAVLDGEQKRLERIVRLDDMRQGGEAAAAHLARVDSSVQSARASLDETNERLADLEKPGAAQRGERTADSPTGRCRQSRRTHTLSRRPGWSA